MYVRSLLFDNKPDFYFVSCTLHLCSFFTILNLFQLLRPGNNIQVLLSVCPPSGRSGFLGVSECLMKLLLIVDQRFFCLKVKNKKSRNRSSSSQSQVRSGHLGGSEMNSCVCVCQLKHHVAMTTGCCRGRNVFAQWKLL